MTFRALLAACTATWVLTTAPAGAQNSPARPGDRVFVRIARDTSIADTLIVDPQGMVVLPFAGDVRVGGVSGDAIQDTIRARLSRFVAPTLVQATLLRRVRVIGEVSKPGVFWVDRTFTLRDAIAIAGGVSSEGQERRVTLDRDGKQQLIRDWHTASEANTPVQSGDQLVVSRLPWYQRNALAVVTAVSVIASIVITISR